MATIKLSGKVTRIGEGRDVQTENGTLACLDFDLCVNRGGKVRTSLKDPSKQYKSDFFRCTVWGQKAINFYKLCNGQTGRIVEIDGKFLLDEWARNNAEVYIDNKNPLYALISQYGNPSMGITYDQRTDSYAIKAGYIEKTYNISVDSFTFLDNNQQLTGHSENNGSWGNQGNNSPNWSNNQGNNSWNNNNGWGNNNQGGNNSWNNNNQGGWGNQGNNQGGNWNNQGNNWNNQGNNGGWNNKGNGNGWNNGNNQGGWNNQGSNQNWNNQNNNQGNNQGNWNNQGNSNQGNGWENQGNSNGWNNQGNQAPDNGEFTVVDDNASATGNTPNQNQCFNNQGNNQGNGQGNGQCAPDTNLQAPSPSEFVPDNNQAEDEQDF